MDSGRSSRERAPSYGRIEEDVDGENKFSVLVPGEDQPRMQTIVTPEELQPMGYNINSSEMASQKGNDVGGMKFGTPDSSKEEADIPDL